MLKIHNFTTTSPEQYEMVIEGMRNPMNSWALSDSHKTHVEDPETLETADFAFYMGENDHVLALGLSIGGGSHAKYRRMMPVWLTVTAPLYWWKEFDTYKIGTVSNSCSTMHKIHEKEFTLEDFSHEQLVDSTFTGDNGNRLLVDVSPYHDMSISYSPKGVLDIVIKMLNEARNEYLETNDKKYWWQMIQLLPSSYNQRRTIMLNYEVLAAIYKDRRNHKLDEWHRLCNWIEELPYSELITCDEESAKKEFNKIYSRDMFKTKGN